MREQAPLGGQPCSWQHPCWGWCSCHYQSSHTSVGAPPATHIPTLYDPTQHTQSVVHHSTHTLWSNTAHTLYGPSQHTHSMIQHSTHTLWSNTAHTHTLYGPTQHTHTHSVVQHSTHTHSVVQHSTHTHTLWSNTQHTAHTPTLWSSTHIPHMMQLNNYVIMQFFYPDNHCNYVYNNKDQFQPMTSQLNLNAEIKKPTWEVLTMTYIFLLLFLLWVTFFFFIILLQYICFFQFLSMSYKMHFKIDLWVHDDDLCMYMYIYMLLAKYLSLLYSAFECFFIGNAP